MVSTRITTNATVLAKRSAVHVHVNVDIHEILRAANAQVLVNPHRSLVRNQSHGGVTMVVGGSGFFGGNGAHS